MKMKGWKRTGAQVGNGREYSKCKDRGPQGRGGFRKLNHLVWLHRGSVSKIGRRGNQKVGSGLGEDPIGGEGAISRYSHKVVQ